MVQNDDNLGELGGTKLYCENCDYHASDKWKYERHLLTTKHKNNDKKIHYNDITGEKGGKTNSCECGKKYSYRQGLHTHRKICKIYNENYNKIIKKVANEVVIEKE